MRSISSRTGVLGSMIIISGPLLQKFRMASGHTVPIHSRYAMAVTGAISGITVCKELLLGDPHKKYALVVCSDKLSLAVNYTDKTAVSSFSFADGAVAAVLKKNHPANQLAFLCKYIRRVSCRIM